MLWSGNLRLKMRVSRVAHTHAHGSAPPPPGEGVVPQQLNLACIKFNLSWYNYCIVSFQINPHWRSNSGLWKVYSTKVTFRERPGKLTNWILVHQDNAPAHKSVVAMAAVVLWTGWSPSIFSWFCTIWLLFSVLQHEKTLGWGAVSDRWWGHYLLLITFSRIRMRASSTTGTKRCNTDGRSVWTAGEIMLKKVNIIWSSSTIASYSAYEVFSPPSYFPILAHTHDCGFNRC